MGRLGDSSVPTLPEVAVKVVQLVGNPHASLKDFVEVVQNDQALTARLLRTANSALYAQRQPVTQLQRAMVLLGLTIVAANQLLGKKMGAIFRA
jgi:HD-like signal output (HDOD) protein